jgi:hypothetical protein
MVLNFELYHLLRKRFGKENVKVRRENVPMRCRYTRRYEEKGCRTSLTILPEGRGEEYSVCCPFCNDTRFRLSVNHRWGLFDPETGSRNLWLATCYNEECTRDYAAQRDLCDQVYSFASFGTSVLKSPESAVMAGIKHRRDTRLPTGLWPLEDMCSRSPRHPAITYLQDRLIDPVNVGRRYKATYCVDNTDLRVSGRLVVPIIFDNTLVAWQARLLRKPIDKRDLKWFTAPGASVGSCLYNGDIALKHQTVVLVEGIMDVWGFGPQACGVFKKSISVEQLQILCARTDAATTLVLLFDPDQADKEKEKGREHHIAVAEKLLRNSDFAGSVLPVYLPSGTDPGDLDRAYMRALIRHEASKAGVFVSFGR